MDENSTVDKERNIHNLTDEFKESNNGNNHNVIVVDGRGYENNSSNNKEIHNLVEVIENTQAGDTLYEEIMKKTDEIIERIARKIVPEIAERIIKEEIEKIKNAKNTE